MCSWVFRSDVEVFGSSRVVQEVRQKKLKGGAIEGCQCPAHYQQQVSAPPTLVGRRWTSGARPAAGFYLAGTGGCAGRQTLAPSSPHQLLIFAQKLPNLA
ncbi:hypothetical protein Q3G72_012011 [Acer saccharum]|nr:hypothetical protein Q3G72_012011 [Acer saccharum]